MDMYDDPAAICKDGVLPEELSAARRVIASLLLAGKNLALYPEGHSISLHSIQQLHSHIEAYLQLYGDLRLNIERDRILLRGKEVHSEPLEEGNLTFTLFRDGIRWLEFMKGIVPYELQEIVRIINNYRILTDTSDGDVVTSFWEAQFPHMRYEVAEFVDSGGQPTDEQTTHHRSAMSSAPLREASLEHADAMVEPGIDPESMVLTPGEADLLREMVGHEENADPTAYLDALLDSLLQYRDRQNFEVILEVLSEEFSQSIARREFSVSLKILQGVRHVLQVCSTDMPWAVSCIDDFSLAVSSGESLEPLAEAVSSMDQNQAEHLGNVFMLLEPSAVTTLGPLLGLPHPQWFRQTLEEAIVSLAARDMGPLESLLGGADERVVEHLLPALARMDGDRPLKALTRMIRHPSPRVRQEAIKGILQRGQGQMKMIFGLIDDKDDSIRRLVLTMLGRSRNRTVEGHLLGYLQNRAFPKGQDDHVLACFKALGQCGSPRCVPFLRRELLRLGWMPSFWRTAYRTGAAVALNALGTQEARQVLDDAARWYYPGARAIVRKTRQKTT